MTATGLDRSVTAPLQRVMERAPPGSRTGFQRDRWWFLIVFLFALAIFGATDTGRIVFDTKLGVDIHASQFFGRLWSLWNPLEWLGSLQDQYIGYAIPMAPFFLAGQLMHVPVWLVERLWLSLLIAVGFLGMVKLGRALRIGSESSRLLAGVVFVLWPTFTIAIGSTSAAALPGLIAPWAVLPLIPAVSGRQPAVRAAARSGLAVAAMGGVNAASTMAVLLLPAVYILTHARHRQRVNLVLTWGTAVVAATAWWVVPLLLQGKYGFNFLPYIEQAATTARTTSAEAVLRGASTWFAYLDISGAPWNIAGWTLATSAAALLATAVVSAAGLAGLARRDMPERRWLCLCTGLVAVAVMAGYGGPLGGPLHGWVGQLLDGPLAPFRSTYKFEPVIAVTLALGCAHALHLCWQRSIRLGRVKVAGSAALAPVVGLALMGLAVPQLTGNALQAGSFSAIPGYWYQAASYLAAHSPRQAALVVPANPHGQFLWGDTIDNPLEPLATSPWVERALVPYGGAGSQVLLETAEQAIESGQQVPGLAPYLARAGIRYVVVRNDSSLAIDGYTAPQVVNETLVMSGFRRVAAFGPPVGASPGYPNVAGQKPGFRHSYPAVEVFAAGASSPRAASPATTLPASLTTLVNGGPDSLLQLLGQGIVAGQPAVLAGQPLASKPALWAVTDGQRRADNDFGTTSGFMSYPYTATGTNPASDPLGAAGGPPRQLLPVAAAGNQTVAVVRGAASVTASSAGLWSGESTLYDPVNAFDGNPGTAWAEASPGSPVGQWIQINFAKPVDLPARAAIQLLDDSSVRETANELQATSAVGGATTQTVSTAARQVLRLPPGPTRWLRITIAGANNVVPGDPGAGISDVTIPGVRATSYLQPAEDPAGAKAPAVAFSFSQPQVGPGSGAGVVNRTFDLPAAASLTAQATAVPEPGPALAALLSRLTRAGPSRFSVTATSTWDWLPQFGPTNLFNPRSHVPWLASGDDANPALVLRWHGRRTISELVLRPALGLASTPTGVLVGSPAGARLANVDLSGVARISPPLRTSRLVVTFNARQSSVAGNTAAGQPATLPVGLARISVPGLAGLRAAVPRPSAPFQLPCGQGPEVTVDGRSYPTAVSGRIGDLLQLRPVRLSLCTLGGELALPAGRQWLTTTPSANFAVTGIRLSSPAATAPAAQPRPLRVLTWQPDNRTLAVGAGPESYVEIHENANPGWTAALDGHRLTAVTLDGWQQGFLVPAGRGGTITLTFTPAGFYHAGLIAAAILLVMLTCLAAGGIPRRRRPDGTLAAQPPAAALPPPPAPARQDPSPATSLVPAYSGQLELASSGAVRARHAKHRGAGRIGYGWATAPGLAVSRSRAARADGLLTMLPLTAVIFLAGGLVAVVVPVLALVGRRWAGRLPLIAAGAMLVAGVVAASAHVPTLIGNGPFSGLAQFFALVALAAALLPATAPAPDTGWRPADLPGRPRAREIEP